MAYYEIPLTPAPQRFQITLEGNNYSCNLYWSWADGLWVLDLLDENEVPILTAIPLVTGVDLLGQHKHLGIGGGLLVQVDGNPYGLPTYQNLGTDARLIFETVDE